MAQPQPEPVDSLPVTIEVATAALVSKYAEAEQELIAGSAAIIAQHLGDDSPQAQRSLYAALQALARSIATRLGLEVGALSQGVAVEAARRGSTAALREVREALTNHPALRERYTRANGMQVTPHGLNAAQHIARDLTDRLTAANQRINRFSADAYQAATAKASIGLVVGGTPQEAQREAWRELTDGGVTGFRDSAGRDWTLSTYVEMATRTAAIRAYNESHQDRMTSLGIRYWTVAPTGFPCKLCLPWEGRILSRKGAGRYMEDDATGKGRVAFQVAGTVAEARAAGLQHPNCKHTLIAYFPGVTKLVTRTPEEIAEATERFKETQKLRHLERLVRAAKTAESAALTDTDRAAARRRAREIQARIREFTAETGLLRRPARERVPDTRSTN
ncbi:hypothetical protein QN084_06350 [Paenarthrobacter sp. R1]|uniref:phage minor capsid protein n=1 Tax=Paenarthrobacter sp. R1 TaxID=3049085 RepID=UPI002556CD99|nr:phage minor capsid protein [Paenarthrobacter sp. R1]WIV32227.1 hypothetical protein QN084_06350 [Paenarthrobacter sp. R1]